MTKWPAPKGWTLPPVIDDGAERPGDEPVDAGVACESSDGLGAYGVVIEVRVDHASTGAADESLEFDGGEDLRSVALGATLRQGRPEQRFASSRLVELSLRLDVLDRDPSHVDQRVGSPLGRSSGVCSGW